MIKNVKISIAVLMCLVLCGGFMSSGSLVAAMSIGIQPRESKNVSDVGFYVSRTCYNGDVSFNDFATGYFSLTVKKYSPGRDPIWQHITSTTQSFKNEMFALKEVQYNQTPGTYKVVIICTSTVLGNTETKTYESGDFILK